MMQFSWTLLKLYNIGEIINLKLLNFFNKLVKKKKKSLHIYTYNFNIGNFTEESEHLKQQFAIRVSETVRAIKTAMAFAPREVWKCDPNVHKRGMLN